MNITSQNDNIVVTFSIDEAKDINRWLEVGFLNDLRDVDTDNLVWISKWSDFILELDKVRHK